MSGHSKWATTKHKKALIDSKRSKSFSKLSNAIAIAARLGKDPAHNPTLRDIVAKARNLNMPGENINRAIKRGCGEIPGVIVDEYVIEVYGPEGTALLIKIITDNKNRTLGELKSILHKHGARLAENGSVQWMFTEMVCIETPLDAWHKQELAISVIDAGASEITEGDDLVFIFCHKSNAEGIKTVLTENNLVADSYITYLPNNPMIITDNQTQNTLRSLINELEELGDIDSTYLNAYLE